MEHRPDHEETDSDAHAVVAHEQAIAAAQAAQAHQQAAEVANVVNGAAAAIQAAAAVAAASAWATATAAAAAQGHGTQDSEGSLEMDAKMGSSKMRRAAWTTDEETRLTELANRYASAGQRMCWRLIAQELGTGRTSKQCREHYLNSLRPNMKKGQWTQREEYIIAREHARNGSHWCIIAKKLPGRTDNSIKNFYNATVRSKAINKHESFLWLYVDKIQRGGLPPKDALAVATEIWSASVSPALVNEVLHEDGAEALMLLSGKRKGEEHESLEALVNRASRGGASQLQSLLQPDRLQQLMAGMKRERPDAPLSHAELAILFGGGGIGALEDAKRQKLEQGLISPNAAATAAGLVAAAAPGSQQDRQRQELLQQLGIVGGNSLPLPQQQLGQAGGGQIDLQLLQQQLLLQQLLNAATNNPAAPAASGPSNGAGPSSGYNPQPNNLVSLLQQITAQSVLLSASHQQQQPQTNAGLQQLMGLGPGGTPPANAAGGNSLLSLLGMQDSGGLGQQMQPDAAAAAIAAAAAQMEMQHGDVHEVKQEVGPDGMPLADQHVLEAAAAAAASAAAQAHAQAQEQQALAGSEGQSHGQDAQALHAAAMAQAQAHGHDTQALEAAVAGHGAYSQDNVMQQQAAIQQALGLAGISADALLAAMPSSDMGHNAAQP